MRKTTFILFFALLLPLCSCNQLRLPDNWQEINQQHIQDSLNARKVKDTIPPVFSYFAFLKEDNPQLENDIVCNDLGHNTILVVTPSKVDYPLELVPRFNIAYGSILYNGDTLVSGQSRMYCSTANAAQLRIEGDDGQTLYRRVAFMPYTGLPVIVVDTEGQAKISSKEVWQNAVMRTYGFGKFADGLDSVFVKKSGNGTAASPKVSFNMKCSSRKSMLGMPRHKRWCFLANFRDRTEIRNAVAFEMGRLSDGLEWTPRSEFAEVVLNGKHEGLYQITEQIRADENRVPIDEIESASDDISGGYLLETDSHYDEQWKFKTSVNNWPVMVKSPDSEVCDSTRLEYLQDYYADLENALIQGRFTYIYDNLIDLDSYVDYYIVQMLAVSGEFASGESVFGYKKRDGKLFAGPLWDFEHDTFNGITDRNMMKSLWYRYMIDDPVFAEALKVRWNTLKPVYESHIFDYIGDLRDKLSVSAHIDESIYAAETASKNGDNDLSYEDAVDKLCDILRQRIIWLDSVIQAL